MTKDIVVVGSCTSTNDYLRIEIETGNLSIGDTVLALEQTHGKGQLGTKWISEPGKNITITISTPIYGNLNKPDFISMAVGVSVLSLVSKLAPHCQIAIKWPNDVLVFTKDTWKKTAGILIEKVKLNHQSALLIGIGINLNQTDFYGVNNATSILNITGGKELDIIETSQQLLTLIKGYLELTPDSLKPLYTRNLLGYGEKREFIFGQKRIQGVVMGINESGELGLMIEKSIRYFQPKELVWVL